MCTQVGEVWYTVFMYNPLAKDQIGANVTAAATGYKAYQNGATGFEAVNVGLWWRWWYKNLTLAFFLLFWAVGLTVAQLINDKEPLLWWVVWIGPVQVLVDVFVFSIAYVSLVDVSAGFKQRLWYRLWAPIQHRFFPNVMRMWWYMLALFPGWLLLWVWLFLSPTYTMTP